MICLTGTDQPRIAEIKCKPIRIFCICGTLHDIYTTFRGKLRDQHLAYEGMLERMVAERADSLSTDRIYVFVGFNALNSCEKTLFKALDKKVKPSLLGL